MVDRDLERASVEPSHHGSQARLDFLEQEVGRLHQLLASQHNKRELIEGGHRSNRRAAQTAEVAHANLWGELEMASREVWKLEARRAEIDAELAAAQTRKESLRIACQESNDKLQSLRSSLRRSHDALVVAAQGCDKLEDAIGRVGEEVLMLQEVLVETSSSRNVGGCALASAQLPLSNQPQALPPPPALELGRVRTSTTEVLGELWRDEEPSSEVLLDFIDEDSLLSEEIVIEIVPDIDIRQVPETSAGGPAPAPDTLSTDRPAEGWLKRAAGGALARVTAVFSA